MKKIIAITTLLSAAGLLSGCVTSEYVSGNSPYYVSGADERAAYHGDMLTGYNSDYQPKRVHGPAGVAQPTNANYHSTQSGKKVKGHKKHHVGVEGPQPQVNGGYRTSQNANQGGYHSTQGTQQGNGGGYHSSQSTNGYYSQNQNPDDGYHSSQTDDNTGGYHSSQTPANNGYSSSQGIYRSRNNGGGYQTSGG